MLQRISKSLNKLAGVLVFLLVECNATQSRRLVVRVSEQAKLVEETDIILAMLFF